MGAMAILKFEPSNECTFLRVKIARDVQERVERYRAFRAQLNSPIWSSARSST
jgi:hypothetical protein